MKGPIMSRRGLLRSSPALLLFQQVARSGEADAGNPFRHGVASGDPSPEGVVIWTRVHGQSKAISVNWEIAADPHFKRIMQRGETTTGPYRDHTVKIDVSGLRPGSTYYYRFHALDSVSATGRTKTLRTGPISQSRLAVCSCSNYPAGYFNVYRAMAERNDLDAVIHLGDYIYEYGSTGYATQRAKELGRVPVPDGEIVNLSDYRLRYAQYRSDPDLQALHASHPMIASWDDHEITNDAWMHGAQNHQPEQEGDWATRRLAALQAYYEWMPIREAAGHDRTAAYRQFEFGDLITLILLETRVHARDRQISAARGEIPLISRDFDISNPAQPRLLPKGSDNRAEATETLVIPFDVTQENPEPILDYQRIKSMADTLPAGFSYLPDAPRFRDEVVGRPDRTLLGQQQREWLDHSLQASVGKSAWRLIGSQVLMSPITAPDLHRSLTPEQKQRMPQAYRAYLPFTAEEIPFNMDAWDGYGWEREWLLDRLASIDAPGVSIAGDTHTAWANEMTPAGDHKSVCAEFGTTSITSPDIGQALGVPATDFSHMVRARNPHVRYCHTHQRGYLELEFSRGGVVGHYHYTPSITDVTAGVARQQSWQWSGRRGARLKSV